MPGNTGFETLFEAIFTGGMGAEIVSAANLPTSPVLLEAPEYRVLKNR